jgi:MerR family transcriptional regulator, copper efflux regulator
MKISELAKRCGVSPHALRHYERLGLLQPVRRDNGYREYSESMRREVVFISMSRKIGFSLAAIAEQLPVYRAGRLSIADMVESLHYRIAEIDQQIVDLGVIRDEVRSHIEWLQAPQKSRSPSPSPSKQPRKRKTP